MAFIDIYDLDKEDVVAWEQGNTTHCIMVKDLTYGLRDGKINGITVSLTQGHEREEDGSRNPC